MSVDKDGKKLDRESCEKSEVGCGGPPRPLVATGMRKKLNREARERKMKHLNEGN